ncbi:MAG TPA: SDR family oxidoreductase [Patescibacteria group bacterium]
MIKTALITGASQGIGAAFARLLGEQGYNLILLSQNKVLLEALAREIERDWGVTVSIEILDLSDTLQRRKTIEKILDHHTVDVLINNAGFGLSGSFIDTSLDYELGMIEVHVAATTEVTKLVLKQMKGHHKGHIINVASTAAFQPGPFMAVYYATKAYILSFSEALAEELKKSGISVTALCPGPTKTGFATRAHMLQTNLFTRHRLMSAELVALIGYRGMLNGKRVVVPGTLNTIGSLATRIVPRPWVFRIMRGVHSRSPRRTAKNAPHS